MEVVDAVKHYQRSLERCSGDVQRMLHCISKLSRLPVTVQHLQDTGVGRTVNALRKYEGDVGNASKALVLKWKAMVAEAESSEGETCDDYERAKTESPPPSICPPANRSLDSEDSNSHRENKSSEKYKSNRNQSSDSIKVNYKNSQSKSHHYSNKRHIEEESRRDAEKRRKRIEEEQEYDDSGHDSRAELENEESDALVADSDHSEGVNDNLTETEDVNGSLERSVNLPSHELKSKQKSHGSSNSSHDRHNSHKHSSKSIRSHSNDVNKSDKSNKRDNVDVKYDKKSEKRNDSKSSVDHSSKDKSKNKDREKRKEKEINKGNEKEKDIHEEKKFEGSRKDSSDKKKKSSKAEKVPSEKQDKHTSSKSSSSKADSKNKSSSTKKNKVSLETPEDGIDSFSGTSFADALGMMGVMDNVSKKKKKSSAVGNSSSKKVEKSSESVPSTSSATYSKTKLSSPNLQKQSHSSREEMNLLDPSMKLQPLDSFEMEMEVDVDATLPVITPNYRPLPHLHLDSHSRAKVRALTEEEALSQVMSTKNQRTKVYSGVKSGKSWASVPSLYDICVRVLQENIDALEYTGGVPFDLLKPVLTHATPEQLFTLEHYNPYLVEDTDELWQSHVRRKFRNDTRMDMETYREMFQRCVEESEAKLRALTMNIQNSMAKRNEPVRQTKLAFVDSVVKPPRQVARKQAKYGTANATSTTPMAKVQKLASPAGAGSSNSSSVKSVPPPRVSHSVPKAKPRVAPLMQKTLKFAKSFKR